MDHMRNPMAVALVCIVLTGLAAPSQAASPAQDRERIGQLVETFRVSLIKKDKDSFLKLFYSDTIPWIGVTTDKSLARQNAAKKDPKKPDAGKLFASSNPRDFIEGIVKSPNALEETFENIRIDSDGDVAQVWFDYSFVDDGHKANWGKESWHLVRTSEGWKISSVIWSMEFNPEPAPKREK